MFPERAASLPEAQNVRLCVDAMEVVEATAAQLETLKFNVSGFGVGQGQAVPSPGSVPVPEPPPPLQSDEGSPDTGQAAETQRAEEQPPEPVLSTAVGESSAPQLGPEPPLGGNCVTGTGASQLAQSPGFLEISDSDSESDRSGASRSRRWRGEGLCNPRGEPEPGGRAGARVGLA